MSNVINDTGNRNAEYIRRINRVMDYIESHLDENLTLERLAYIACFSRFHFHRIFQSVTNERLAVCIQRMRIEKAATLLLNSPNTAITEIAHRCGFASSGSFANAFKRYFGKSASLYRSGGRTETERSYIRWTKDTRDSLDIRIDRGGNGLLYKIKGAGYERQVAIVELPSWHIAYIRYTGPYKGDSALFARLWNKLAAWAAPRGLLHRPDSVFLTLCHDDPEITMEEKLRISVGIGIDDTITPSGEVGTLRLPGGTYAVCRFLLGPQDYPDAWGWMYGTWLPLSGYQPDDRIAFERIHQQQGFNADGKISIDICIPVTTVWST